MKSSRILMMLLCLFLLSACHVLADKTAYLKANNNRKLIIPPGLSSKKVGDTYVIPATPVAGPLPAPIHPPGE